MTTSALMGAPVGMYFHGTAIAYLEHAARFKAPVRAGDTLTTTWTVAAKHAKPRHGGGVVVLAGVCRNQDEGRRADGRMVADARRRDAGPRAEPARVAQPRGQRDASARAHSVTSSGPR